MRKRLSLLFLSILTVTGCAGPVSRPRRAAVRAPRPVTAEQLLSRLSEGAGGLTTLTAGFSASLADTRSGKRQTCSGMLALARPDRLRMKASKAMLPTFFDLLVDGDTITLFVPRERTVYRGISRGEATIGGVTDARILGDVLWGGEADGGLVHFIEISRPFRILYSIALNGERGILVRKVFFGEVDLRPVRYQYFNGRGECTRDVRCSDFFTTPRTEIVIPRHIVIDAPEAGRRMELRLKKIKANTDLNPSLFYFEMPEGATVRPLEEYPR